MRQGFFLLIVAKWQYLIWVNFSSANGLLSDGAKPLPEPMLTCLQIWSVAFTGEPFHKMWSWTKYVAWVLILHFCNYGRISLASELTEIMPHVSLKCAIIFLVVPINNANLINQWSHYSAVIMSVMAPQITGVSIVCSTICSGTIKENIIQCSASLAFMMGIHRWLVDSPHKRPVTWKMFPFDVYQI